jgi:hypothetical protein
MRCAGRALQVRPAPDMRLAILSLILLVLLLVLAARRGWCAWSARIDRLDQLLARDVLAVAAMHGAETRQAARGSTSLGRIP